MGKSISESIDELFDNTLGGLPSKRPKRLQEEVTSSSVFDQGVVDELYDLFEEEVSSSPAFDQGVVDELHNLFEEEVNDNEIITESIVEEVVEPTIQEDVVETPVRPTPEVDVTSQLNSVDYLADKLTRYVKRTNTGVQPEQEVNINEAIENLTRQIHDVRRMVLENTIVSGIGQGGDGQTPGSGEVLLNRLDDVDPSQLNHGDTLVWNSEENKWVTSNVFVGNIEKGDVTTDIVGLINSNIIKSIIGRIRSNTPDLENLSTQEDANLEILRTLLKLEQHKPTIKISEEKDFESPSEMDNSLDIGDLRIDYTTHIMYYWNGNRWQALNADCCFEQTHHYIIDGLHADSTQSDYEGDFEDLLADIGVFDGIDGDAGDASFDPNLDTEGED